MDRAFREALRLGDDHIAPEHVLLGLLGDESCAGCEILDELGVDLSKLRTDIESAAEHGERTDLFFALHFTNEAKTVLELTLEEAARLNHEVIDTKHLLLGLLSEAKSRAARALAESGVDVERVRLLAIGRIETAVDESDPSMDVSLPDQLKREAIQRHLDRAKHLLVQLEEFDLAAQLLDVRRRLDE